MENAQINKKLCWNNFWNPEHRARAPEVKSNVLRKTIITHQKMLQISQNMYQKTCFEFFYRPISKNQDFRKNNFSNFFQPKFFHSNFFLDFRYFLAIKQTKNTNMCFNICDKALCMQYLKRMFVLLPENIGNPGKIGIKKFLSEKNLINYFF